MTPGADYYTVEGVTEQGLMVSCTTNDTYCALYNMDCGQMYSINVTAHNHVCQGVSTSTETVAITTGEKTDSLLKLFLRLRGNACLHLFGWFNLDLGKMNNSSPFSSFEIVIIGCLYFFKGFVALVIHSTTLENITFSLGNWSEQFFYFISEIVSLLIKEIIC